MSDIGEQVMKMIVEHMGIYADKVTPDASFLDDLAIRYIEAAKA